MDKHIRNLRRKIKITKKKFRKFKNTLSGKKNSVVEINNGIELTKVKSSNEKIDP